MHRHVQIPLLQRLRELGGKRALHGKLDAGMHAGELRDNRRQGLLGMVVRNADTQDAFQPAGPDFAYGAIQHLHHLTRHGNQPFAGVAQCHAPAVPDEDGRADDPYSWEAIDHLLTETTLTTLPLWLLGSDLATQQIIAGIMEEEGYRAEFALDLARKFASERDYASALMYATDHVNATGDVSLWASNFYTYLLGKNGNADQAAPILSQLEGLQQPAATRFVEWYSDKFEIDASAAPRVAETF